MNAPAPRSRLNWSARLLIGLTLIIIGAGAATWALARYQRAAHLLGVAPAAAPAVRAQPVANVEPALPDAVAADQAAAIEARVAGLEARLTRAENAARRAEGSAGRTDALVVAFAFAFYFLAHVDRVADKGGFYEAEPVEAIKHDHRVCRLPEADR